MAALKARSQRKNIQKHMQNPCTQTLYGNTFRTSLSQLIMATHTPRMKCDDNSTCYSLLGLSQVQERYNRPGLYIRVCACTQTQAYWIAKTHANIGMTVKLVHFRNYGITFPHGLRINVHAGNALVLRQDKSRECKKGKTPCPRCRTWRSR